MAGEEQGDTLLGDDAGDNGGVEEGDGDTFSPGTLEVEFEYLRLLPCGFGLDLLILNFDSMLAGAAGSLRLLLSGTKDRGTPSRGL
jgi:hypothetical protein